MQAPTDIFTVTFRRDFQYFEMLARSVRKYARGFRKWHIVVPACDAADVVEIIHSEQSADPLEVQVYGENEWPGQGFLWHEYQVFTADKRTDADFILHADADYVFIKESFPNHFRHGGDGPPFLCYESFKSLMARNAFDGLLAHWRVAAEAATGFVVPNETMWQQPLVYRRDTHYLARRVVELHRGTTLEQYVREQKDAHPQTFAEFTTLGAVAWELQRSLYHWINTGVEQGPERRVYQAWSRVEPRSEDIAVWEKAGLL